MIVGAAEKAEAIGQNFKGSLAEHQPVKLDPLLEDLEDKVLLLHAGHITDLLRPGEFNQLTHRQFLELGDVRIALLLEQVIPLTNLEVFGIDLGGNLLGDRDRFSVKPAVVGWWVGFSRCHQLSVGNRKDEDTGQTTGCPTCAEARAGRGIGGVNETEAGADCHRTSTRPISGDCLEAVSAAG